MTDAELKRLAEAAMVGDPVPATYILAVRPEAVLRLLERIAALRAGLQKYVDVAETHDFDIGIVARDALAADDARMTEEDQ